MLKEQSRSATDSVSIAKVKARRIIADEIPQTQIDVVKSRLEQSFATTKPVKDTQKLHSAVVVRQDVIECRIHSDATSKWTIFF